MVYYSSQLGGSTVDFPTTLESVDGARSLYEWFGSWPSFHDAEVISLHLDRRGISSLAVHTWEMTKDVDDKGYYIHARHVVVEFTMKDVIDLNLNGFNHQNVIFGLGIERTENGYRLTLDDCYGIAGDLEAKDISIRLIPGKPEVAVVPG
jgi:Immunity protein 50